MTLDAFHQYIFVMLRRVGTHLQPQDAAGLVNLTVAQNDVAVVQRFRSKRQTAVYLAVTAVLNDNAFSGTVGLVLIGPGALATFDNNGIVVDMHEAAINEYVVANININGIARRCSSLGIFGPDIFRRRIDVTVKVAHMVTPVDMVRPYRRVDEVYILNGDVLTVRHIGQSGALGILVGTLRIPASTNPELLPVLQSVAINGTRSADGESIQPVGIDERREELARLPLEASAAADSL